MLYMKTALKIFLSIVFLIALGSFYLAKHQLPKTAEQTKLPTGLHYSINGTKEFFDQAYQNVNYNKPDDQIFGITVNHHLLAPNLIAQEFAEVQTDKPITVVLISPNHFYKGNGGLITSSFDWQTPFGVLETDKDLVTKLKDTGLVNIDERPFDQEHGINAIVGFIKKSLPNAKFVPIIVKENLSDENADQLAEELTKLLPQDALVVGSLDFSHYLVSNGAIFHDTQTLSAMYNFDYDRLKKLDVDSHPGLRLLMKYFDLKGDKKFVVTSHENSSTVTGNFSFVETTSYIDGYFTRGSNDHNYVRTVLYIQGIGKDDRWKEDASERLFKFNDQVTNEKPPELAGINLAVGPVAVGLVYNRDHLSDVYIFPLDITDHLITLQRELNPGTMHLQFK
jgi:AmmeMemoRadiSam system protein B